MQYTGLNNLCTHIQPEVTVATNTNAVRMDEEKQLIAAIVGGDALAVEQAVRLHTPYMRFTAMQLVGQDAADMVQEAWVAALKALPNFEPNVQLKTWLARIVVNKCYDHLRKAKAHPVTHIDDDSLLDSLFNASGHWADSVSPWQADSPEALLESHALQGCLDKHIGLLPQGQKDIFVMAVLNDMPLVEVRALLEVSESNARVLLHRAKNTLLHMVQTYEREGVC